MVFRLGKTFAHVDRLLDNRPPSLRLKRNKTDWESHKMEVTAI